MNDLKNDLASLRLNDDSPRSKRGLWITLGIVAVLVIGGGAAWWSRTAFAATEVETTRPTVERAGENGQQGTPLLTASGYVVARRRAVVSAKIQGRLADLRVEEGSRVQENQVIARLESADFEAQVRRAKAQMAQADAQSASARAQIQRADADLAEARRQLGVNERLTKEQILPTDTLDASRSRVQVLIAAVAQAQADAARRGLPCHSILRSKATLAICDCTKAGPALACR